MAEKLGARKNSEWKAVCTAPDFCKTPVGSSTPPIPYQVIADLGQSENCVPSVRFNGDPCKVLNQSVVPKCTGDEPGAAKGVKSGTVADKVEPRSASSSVRAGKKRVVRQGDSCTLNSGNCPGIYVTQPAPGCAVGAGGNPTGKANPAVEQSEREKSRLERLASWWDQKKAEMGAAAEDPGQGTIGALKDTANTVPEVGEMISRGSGRLQAFQLEQQAKLARMIGLEQTANHLQAEAGIMRQIADGISFPKFELSNAAQAGGATIAQGIQLATGLTGLAKGAARVGVKALAKSGGRVLAGEVDDAARIAAKGSTAAREIKTADAVTDATVQGARKPLQTGGVKIKKAPMSLREQYLGRTPGKGSKTGKEVIERMRKEGKIREVDGETFFKSSDGNWYPLREADMAHKVDAVTWWNETGRQYGARVPEVRKWMLDPNNYTLQHFSINRSLGAQIGQGYLPPIRP